MHSTQARTIHTHRDHQETPMILPRRTTPTAVRAEARALAARARCGRLPCRATRARGKGVAMSRSRTGTAYPHGDHFDIRITMPDGTRSKPVCMPPGMSYAMAKERVAANAAHPAAPAGPTQDREERATQRARTATTFAHGDHLDLVVPVAGRTRRRVCLPQGTSREAAREEARALLERVQAGTLRGDSPAEAEQV
jgi:hypothetical protein